MSKKIVSWCDDCEKVRTCLSAGVPLKNVRVDSISCPKKSTLVKLEAPK